MKNTPFKNTGRFQLPRHILWKRVQEVMEEELTVIERETLIAYHMENKNLRQIAEQRSVNQSTVWRNLKRAEEKLRRFLRH